jgi:hypothetical protein
MNIQFRVHRWDAEIFPGAALAEQYRADRDEPAKRASSS